MTQINLAAYTDVYIYLYITERFVKFWYNSFLSLIVDMFRSSGTPQYNLKFPKFFIKIDRIWIRDVHVINNISSNVVPLIWHFQTNHWYPRNVYISRIILKRITGHEMFKTIFVKCNFTGLLISILIPCRTCNQNPKRRNVCLQLIA